MIALLVSPDERSHVPVVERQYTSGSGSTETQREYPRSSGGQRSGSVRPRGLFWADDNRGHRRRRGRGEKWFAASEYRIVVEGGGAVAIAALLHGKVMGRSTMALVVSGGNVDPAVLGEVLVNAD